MIDSSDVKRRNISSVVRQDDSGNLEEMIEGGMIGRNLDPRALDRTPSQTSWAGP